jgi:putative glycosyltransferase
VVLSPACHRGDAVQSRPRQHSAKSGDGAAAQSFTRSEIILANDGSPDGSLELAIGGQLEKSAHSCIDLSRTFGHQRPAGDRPCAAGRLSS